MRQLRGRDLGGKIRYQHPRLTPGQWEALVRQFKAGEKIARLAWKFEIAKAAVQRGLRKRGLR